MVARRVTASFVNPVPEIAQQACEAKRLAIAMAVIPLLGCERGIKPLLMV